MPTDVSHNGSTVLLVKTLTVLNFQSSQFSFIVCPHWGGGEQSSPASSPSPASPSPPSPPPPSSSPPAPSARVNWTGRAVIEVAATALRSVPVPGEAAAASAWVLRSPAPPPARPVLPRPLPALGVFLKLARVHRRSRASVVVLVTALVTVHVSLAVVTTVVHLVLRVAVIDVAPPARGDSGVVVYVRFSVLIVLVASALLAVKRL